MISLGEFIFIMFFMICTLQLTYKGAYAKGYIDCEDDLEAIELAEEEEKVEQMYKDFSGQEIKYIFDLYDAKERK